jgi:hypothetical protein
MSSVTRRSSSSVRSSSRGNSGGSRYTRTSTQSSPPPEPPKKSRTGLIIGIIIGVILLIIIIIVIILLLRNNSSSTPTPSKCVSDSQCGTGKACNLNTGQCTGCLNDTGCTAPLKCNTATQTCVTCVTDANCPSGQICSNNTCQLKPCTSGLDCTNPTAPVCSSGSCVQCAANTDCSGNPVFSGQDKNTCNTTTKQCVACVASGDCPIPGSTCSNNVCVLPDCTALNEAIICTDPTKPRCDVASGDCKQCNVATEGTDCLFFTGANSTCVNGTCVAAECTIDEECTNPLKSICNVDGKCVGCLNNGDCPLLPVNICQADGTCACIAPVTVLGSGLTATAQNQYPVVTDTAQCPYNNPPKQSINVFWTFDPAATSSVVTVSKNADMSSPYPSKTVTGVGIAVISIQDLGIVQKGSASTSTSVACEVPTIFFNGEKFYIQVTQKNAVCSVPGDIISVTFACGVPAKVLTSAASTVITPNPVTGTVGFTATTLWNAGGATNATFYISTTPLGSDIYSFLRNATYTGRNAGAIGASSTFNFSWKNNFKLSDGGTAEFPIPVTGQRLYVAVVVGKSPTCFGTPSNVVSFVIP